MEILEAMKLYRDAGLCPIPVASKRPMLKSWAAVERMPSDQEIESWAGLRTEAGEAMNGVGLVCGRVSGGLICLDIDTKNDPTETMAKEFFDLIIKMGGAGIGEVCVAQKTPSDGYHLIFRCPEIHDGNQVFAKSDETKKAVLETRGQGGQFVAFPSPGYQVIRGSLENVKTLPLAEAELLFSAARAIDRSPLIHITESKPPAAIRSTAEITPIDDYNAKTTIDAMQAEIEAVGFVQLKQRGENIHYRRPGKAGRDTSATLHVGMKRFYVFTTSTELEAGHAYSPAALMCFLHNNGDWSATARALRQAGYGSPRQPQRPAPNPTPNTPPSASPSPQEGGKATQPAQPKADSGVIIISASELEQRIMGLYKRPFEIGKSTGWPALDKHLRIKKKRLNLVTGIPGAGKSSFLNHLFLNLAFRCGWRIAVFSPESETPEDMAANLLEIHCQSPFFGFNRITEAQAAQAAAEISKKFTFMDQDLNGATFDDLLRASLEIKPDALLLDPWNRLNHARAQGVTETEYIGSCLARGAAFARTNDLSLWIVAHPQKVRKDKDGKQIRPGLYDISGSANWANMADNAIMIWRDYQKNLTEIEVIKVRGKRDGEPGVVRMKFEKETGSFRPWTEADDFSVEVPPLKGTHMRESPDSRLPDGDRD